MNINDCKILICDDSILARKQIKDVIATVGEPAIFEASDGQSAIDIYKNEKPNLVFLDIVMPKKDGMGVLEDLKNYAYTKRISIKDLVNQIFENSINDFKNNGGVLLDRNEVDT